MSELIQSQNTQSDMRRTLLATVSSLALAACTCLPAYAADDADRPTVWIELGGQLERVDSKQDAFLPPFLRVDPRPAFEVVPSAVTQRPPRYAIGGEGKITFAPAGSDWSLSAAIRYGRSNTDKHLHQQTTEVRQSGRALQNDDPWYVQLTRFGDTVSAHRESHIVADFMAGRDVGLGLWGNRSSMTVDFGVRFAQFTARSAATIRDRPDPFIERVPLPPTFFQPNWHKYKTNKHNHSYYAQELVTRSFSGIGPTLSLNGSQPFIGNEEAGEISFDWGANAAVLFGRQKVQGSQKTTGQYFTPASSFGPKSTYSHAKPIARSRSVIVPNVGGFAGLTFRRSNTKVSFGYRADFFFGAMDGGIDARNAATVGFHGPFATISIGLGG